MDMSLHVERHEELLVATCRERVTMRDVQDLWRQVVSAGVELVLVDLREVTRMPFYKELQVATATGTPPTSVRAAFVCANSGVSGSARLLSSLSLLAAYEVFSSPDEARAWLGQHPTSQASAGERE